MLILSVLQVCEVNCPFPLIGLAAQGRCYSLSSPHPVRPLAALQDQGQHRWLLGHVLEPANWSDGINTHEPGEAQVAQLVTLAA